MTGWRLKSERDKESDGSNHRFLAWVLGWQEDHMPLPRVGHAKLEGHLNRGPVDTGICRSGAHERPRLGQVHMSLAHRWQS